MQAWGRSLNSGRRAGPVPVPFLWHPQEPALLSSLETPRTVRFFFFSLKTDTSIHTRVLITNWVFLPEKFAFKKEQARRR